MPSNALKLIVIVAAASVASVNVVAAPVDVYSACENGQAKFVRMEASPGVEKLIRQGLAVWSSGVIDRHTIDAMAEGRGMWSLTNPTLIFASLPTKTPDAYLAAIAKTESGRDGRYWPWTINFNGQSLFYETKQHAVDAAKELISAGEKVFDVGLMQVNWYYNGRFFSSIDKAFDPEHNILVADYIVQQHMKETGSLAEAIGRYHSKTPSRKGAYLNRVNSHLVGLRQPLTNVMRMQPCT